MINIIVLPELIYKQYINDGVEFSNLMDLDCLTEVSTINDIVEIDEAITNFPKNFIVDDCLKLAMPPISLIKVKAIEEEFKFVSLSRKINERIESNVVRESEHNIRGHVNTYTLKQIDEHLWVVVQKSLPSVSIDPVKESVIENKPFINDMVLKLLDLFKFEDMSKTNLFRLYLDSNYV